MTDEQLQSALIEVMEYMLEQLPQDEWNYEFSPRFHKKLKQMIMMEKHPIWYYVRRIVAALLLALGISGGLLLGFDEKVRADFVRWIVEHFTENEYKYQNEMGNELDVSKYTWEGLVMEGYQLYQRNEKEEVVIEVYLGEGGNLLVFVVMNSTKNEELILLTDENAKKEITQINGKNADLYVSEHDGESSIITWQGNKGELFSIQGIMDKEMLIELAEKVDGTKFE